MFPSVSPTSEAGVADTQAGLPKEQSLPPADRTTAIGAIPSDALGGRLSLGELGLYGASPRWLSRFSQGRNDARNEGAPLALRSGAVVRCVPAEQPKRAS